MTVNSQVEIQQRVAAGKITWAGPLIMLAARSILAVICQALVASIFYSGSVDAWDEAGRWWTVYGTVIDVGTLVLLVWLTRREGIRLFDLGNYSRKRWLRDVLIGLGLFIVIFPTLLFAPLTFLMTVFDVSPPMGVLPLAGSLYSIIIWPVIWAFTEDNTYLGYSLPRLAALTGRTWIAVVVVVFFATLQHIFLPFRLEWRYLLTRFLSFVPFVIVYCLLYLRQRRLLPIHILHWASNIISPLLALLMAAGGGG
ncbi:type II CAAX prenyl endopeptidase Rce1 family protein [Chloroflexota bacterium]